MNIAYIIYTSGHGRGGHFYSLKAIRDELPINSFIFNIGISKSPVLVNDERYVFIDSKEGPLSICNIIRRLILSKKITHLHSFDYNSLVIGSLLSFITRLPHIHTKPGGPSPKNSFLRIKYLSVFTGEDFKHFSKKKYSRIGALELISNRVSNFDLKADLSSEQESKLKSKIVLMRIARISETYQDSILQTLKLAKELKSSGFPIFTILIGVVESPNVLDLIKEKASEEETLILTEDYYTVNAKRLLFYADIVVGAGRSFMEGVFAKAIMLSPTMNNEMPELINKDNYEAFKETNFTGRNIQISQSKSIQKLEILLASKLERSNYMGFFENAYVRDCAVKGGVEKYLKFYSRCNKCNGFYDAFLNSLHFVIKRVLSR